MPENNNQNVTVGLDLIGDSNTNVPKKVNMFTLQNTPDGIIMSAAYNTKQIEKYPDGTLHSRAYIAQQFLCSPQDLDALAKIIKKHLTESGYYEMPSEE